MNDRAWVLCGVLVDVALVFVAFSAARVAPLACAGVVCIGGGVLVLARRRKGW